MTGILWRSALVLAILLLVGGTWLLLHRRRSRTWAPRVARMASMDLPHVPHPLLIVVFTSRFCVACRDVLRVAGTTAPEVPVVQVPLHERPDVADRYGLVETPTLFLVDEQNRIRYCKLGTVDEAELWLYVREAWDSSTMVRRLTAERASR